MGKQTQRTTGSKVKPTAARKHSLKNLNVQMDPSVIEQVRDCVVALSGPPAFLTMARFVESACEREIERLQQEHRKGKPFARRPEGVGVRRGRPIR